MKTDIEIISSVIDSVSTSSRSDAAYYDAINAGIPIAAILKVINTDTAVESGSPSYDYRYDNVRHNISKKINNLFETEPDLALEYLLNNFSMVDQAHLFNHTNSFKVFELTEIDSFPNLLKKRSGNLISPKEINRFCLDTPASAKLLASCIVHGIEDKYAEIQEQPNFKKNITKDQADRIVDSLIKSGLKRNDLMDRFKLGVPSVASNMQKITTMFGRAIIGKVTAELPSLLCGDEFVRAHAHSILTELSDCKFKSPDYVVSLIQDLKRLDVDLVVMAKVVDEGRYAYFDYKDRSRTDGDMKEVLNIAWTWRNIKGQHFCSSFISIVPLEVIQDHPDSKQMLKIRHAVTGDPRLLKLIGDRKYNGQALESSLGL